MKKFISAIFIISFLLSITTISVFGEVESDYKTGDVVYFGTYPQSKVVDFELLDELNKLELNWVSYGCYSGSNTVGSMTQSDYMKYADAEYNGNKYRAVTFSNYRPPLTYQAYPQESPYGYQERNNYFINTVYWFKYEPLKWRILDPQTGLMMCESVIDVQPYCATVYSENENSIEMYNDASLTTYATDYQTSTLRNWLNEDFYLTAFNGLQFSQIKNTTMNRSVVLSDKVFILSHIDASNLDYGFTVDTHSSYESSDSACDPTRKLVPSDYAQCLGVVNKDGYAAWWTYSPGGSYSIGGTTCDGSFNMLTFPCDNCMGVSPAITVYLNSIDCNHKISKNIIADATCCESGNIRYVCDNCGVFYDVDIPALDHLMSDWFVESEATCLDDGISKRICLNNCGYFETETINAIGHSYIPIITEPTCEKGGYTTYTCACGDTYVDDYVSVLNHEYTTEITTPATHLTEGVKTFTCKCGDSYTDVIEKLEGHTYESVVTAPTCTEKGYTTFACECGDSYKDNFVKSLGHNLGKFVVTKEATCTENGEKKAACLRCDYLKVQKIDAKQHKDANGDESCDVCELYLPSLKCLCVCHAKTIGAFVYKLFTMLDEIFGTRLLEKVFNISDYCTCGLKH